MTHRRRPHTAFTLVEMLISIMVLVVLVLIVSSVVNNASTLATTRGKQISADTQARVVFDRMAIDFARMLKRTDLDYYCKTDDPSQYPGHSYGHSQGHGQRGQSSNDQIAFFSQVAGYYPSGAQSNDSPLSVVAYRVNSNYTSPNYNKLERMSVGLLWNGVSNAPPNNPGYTSPIVFGRGTPLGSVFTGTWPNATNTSSDPAYEVIAPGVFRFEYNYLLKNGILSENPFIDTTARQINGLADVEAISVIIAVIDSKSRALLSDQNILDLAAQMWDFHTVNIHPPPGHGNAMANDIELQWQSVITTNISSGTMPATALSAIRCYTRYFDLNNL
jgi:type II secretory pathway pseudopilin PulG